MFLWLKYAKQTKWKRKRQHTFRQRRLLGIPHLHYCLNWGKMGNGFYVLYWFPWKAIVTKYQIILYSVIVAIARRKKARRYFFFAAFGHGIIEGIATGMTRCVYTVFVLSCPLGKYQLSMFILWFSTAIMETCQQFRAWRCRGTACHVLRKNSIIRKKASLKTKICRILALCYRFLRGSYDFCQLRHGKYNGNSILWRFHLLLLCWLFGW